MFFTHGPRCRSFLLLAASYATVVGAALVPNLEMSFFFDWNPQGQPYPVPVTQQCETINIKWARGAAQGPNPVPPYYLQVYTSIHTVPIIIPAGEGLSYDWAVPFPPGTLYQICMFDKNGNTGGCQATYTVTPSLRTGSPSCANVTLPPQLEVEGIVNNGPISRYGWIEQCSDVQVVPSGGTPPYTFTIAPSLHPPYNITGDGPLNWTISLSWSTPFFISVADSDGRMWANGLLHSGGPGTTACLAGNTTVSSDGQVKPVVAIGAGVGGLGAGLLVGLLSMFFLMRQKLKKLGREREALLDLSGGDSASQNLLLNRHDSQYRPVPTSPHYVDQSTGGTNSNINSMGGNVQYHVEPFIMPDEVGRRNFVVANPASPRSSVANHDPSSTAPHPPSTRPQQSQGAVYVLHHDSNTAPVTIFHEQGQEIVELPPLYPVNDRQPAPTATTSSDGRSPSESGRTDFTSSDVPQFLQQQRRPNQARKPSRDPTSPNRPQGPR